MVTFSNFLHMRLVPYYQSLPCFPIPPLLIFSTHRPPIFIIFPSQTSYFPHQNCFPCTLSVHLCYTPWTFLLASSMFSWHSSHSSLSCHGIINLLKAPPPPQVKYPTMHNMDVPLQKCQIKYYKYCFLMCLKFLWCFLKFKMQIY